tara:strand:+ start:109688 stop:110794 length:1107 start_codon:yes stop_codon:yes gene_type:complete
MRQRLSIFGVVAFVLTATGLHAQQIDERFTQWDRNNDNQLTKDELPKNPLAFFAQMDANGDGAVTREELKSFFASRRDRATQQTADRRTGQATPTHRDVKYGDHERQAFDIWLAEASDGQPTPLVIYIHGGGFRGGDKSNVSGNPSDYLAKGISFASMNYRLSDVGPYPIMMNDCARGLQFIRNKAMQWNLDPDRIACYGGSAGAGISLWLAFHDDLADPDSDDPIARQSTRIVAAGTQNGQPTYDMRTFRQWFGVPDLPPHPALAAFYGVREDADLDSGRLNQLMVDASAINHLSKDDVPVFMAYGKGDVPVDASSDPGLWVHHVKLGLKLKEAMDAMGLECHVNSPDHPTKPYGDIHEFLMAKVQK